MHFASDMRCAQGSGSLFRFKSLQARIGLQRSNLKSGFVIQKIAVWVTQRT